MDEYTGTHLDQEGCHHGAYILVDETDLNKMQNMYYISDNVKEEK